MECNLCPRKCNIDRTKSKGYCSQTDEIYAARAALHFWEEPCISGDEGSGTVFFSGCNLKCVYCQNREIAYGKTGKKISSMRLAEIFIELQNKNANNINLVTGDHFIPQIIKAIQLARKNGLILPVVFNTSSYITTAALELLNGYIDIYLADFKYFSSETARKYSSAPDYPEYAKSAIRNMLKQTGEPRYDSRGIMKKGVIVRHLLLPGYTDESKAIIEYIFRSYGSSVVLSIMNQYTPIQMDNFPELNRRVTNEEYDSVIDYALSLGIEDAYVQEDGTAYESFIPQFDCEGI